MLIRNICITKHVDAYQNKQQIKPSSSAMKCQLLTLLCFLIGNLYFFPLYFKIIMMQLCNFKALSIDFQGFVQ